MSTTISVTGFNPTVTLGGPGDPYSGISLTDSTGSSFTFRLYVSNGHVSANPTLPSGLTLDGTISDPYSNAQISGYYLTGTASAMSSFLSSNFSATTDGNGGTTYTTDLTTVTGTGLGQSAPTATFSGPGISSGSTALDQTVSACYLRGTMIATPSGEVAIENIAIGDTISLADGSEQAVKWVATRSYTRAVTEVQPVCIRAGAIADAVPSRDLFVSPLHAMLIDGVLVPASALVNGLSIVKCADFSTVEYVHLELDVHAALIANGAPSETFTDCGNRWMFHNVEEYSMLYPDEVAATSWVFCAERVESGAVLGAIHARLAARALTLDNVKTQDHRLFVLADGRAVMPEVGLNGRFTFRLPTAPSDLRIVSRRAVPAELGLSDDVRSVGVALRQITLRSSTSAIAINGADCALQEGFHAADGNHRWTNGDAVLPAEMLASLTGPVSLEIDAEGLAFYPADVTAIAA